MNCIVTAGPTYEPLDDVRRLTNFSTGRLGTELANFFTERGHVVTLLIGEQATYAGERRAGRVEMFSSTDDLKARLRKLAGPTVGAVFHAAAVSDFTFGKKWQRGTDGQLVEVKAGKIPTRSDALLVELVPTAKIIAELRDLYPRALLVGWKYEVDGDRDDVLAKAERQLRECRTDACVANGPAFGAGFGLVRGEAACELCADAKALFTALEKLLTGRT